MYLHFHSMLATNPLNMPFVVPHYPIKCQSHYTLAITLTYVKLVMQTITIRATLFLTSNVSMIYVLPLCGIVSVFVGVKNA